MTFIDIDIYIGVLSLFCVLGILLNAGTLVAIVACKSLRKTQNIFTFNIALADLVSSVTPAINWWLVHWIRVPYPILYVVVTGANIMLDAAMTVGICSTLAVAIHRFIIIRVDPFQNRRIVTATRCVITCVIMWVVTTVFHTGIYQRLYGTFIFTSYIIYLTTILGSIGFTGICYTVVYITISKPVGDIGLSSDAYLLRVKRNKKVLVTFFLVVCSNFVCWFFRCFGLLCLLTRPSFAMVYNPTYDRYVYADWLGDLIDFSSWMISINTIINPVIYWTRLSDFRRLICSCFGRRNLKDSSPITKDSKIKSVSGNSENRISMEVDKGMDHGIGSEKENGSV